MNRFSIRVQVGALIILAVLAAGIAPPGVHAQSGTVVTLTINSLVANDLQEDGIINSNNIDEVYIEYSLQEVASNGVRSNNVVVGSWGLGYLEKGERVSAAEFESISLEIAANSGVRVEIHVIESDQDRQGWADMWGAACQSGLIPISCVGDLVVNADNVEFQGPSSAPTYDSAEIRRGVTQTITFTWTNGMNWAEYELHYSLRAASSAPAPAPAAPAAPAGSSSSSTAAWDAQTVLRDDFTGSRLSTANWWLYQRQPAVSGGRLRMQGQNDWNLGIGTTTSIGVNEGIVFLFQYKPGTMGLFLNRNDWDSPHYQRWGFHSGEDNTWNVVTLRGVQGAQDRTYQTVTLRPDTWYYLVFRVDGRGGFDTWVWARDHASSYALSYHGTPYQSEWIGGNWGFLVDVYNGEIQAEFYQKVRFPAGFEMPARPPQIEG